MSKTTIHAFLAGAVVMLGIVYGAGNETPLLMFALGAIVAAGVIGSALLSGNLKVRNIQRRGTASSRPASGSGIAQTGEAELIAALKGLGTTKPAAIAAARQALQKQPGASFQEQLRAAIQFARVSA